MSDFVAGGWSWWIAGVTLLGLAACLALLIVTARRKVVPGVADNSTGHVWDEDLRELNNPLPRWWMVLFVLTIVFALAYLWLYPGLGSAQGRLGWTSSGQHAEERRQAEALAAPVYTRFKAMSIEELAADSEALAVGERLFINHCAACHGSDGRGSKGFPNLTDRDWLWGGSPERVVETITQGRQGQMPPMAAAVGSSEDVHNLAHYVLSLSGSPHDSIAAYLGKPKFSVCAACHGVGGKGNPAIGAPNLSDKTWLHGWGEEAIVAMVTNGKTNVMPAHGERLTPEQIQVLAAYVWGYSGQGR